MLVDVKNRLDEEAIQDLISYSIFPDPDRLEQTVATYREDAALKLYGCESEGEIIGIIGWNTDDNNVITIRHIAVRPDCRGAGFGRGLILEALELATPAAIIAETDEEAVDFYRSIGFQVESVGEKYPGVERFKCVYMTDEDSES
ncbi:GNAT family N-acetyltransferase [Paenibacillus thalictri]|uniref:N-acetyltransferase n=1 Tax=Paenibacillus thalictri TaxID=2527873 RepID=A0A4Q9DS02_9BACL|nr:GNAT family N-acetyltransferase [Paenibacillus thalictri]TBL79579.1 N-acetyltransferase [Paenibacillus thalictri]